GLLVFVNEVDEVVLPCDRPGDTFVGDLEKDVVQIVDRVDHLLRVRLLERSHLRDLERVRLGALAVAVWIPVDAVDVVVDVERMPRPAFGCELEAVPFEQHNGDIDPAIPRGDHALAQPIEVHLVELSKVVLPGKLSALTPRIRVAASLPEAARARRCGFTTRTRHAAVGPVDLNKQPRMRRGITELSAGVPVLGQLLVPHAYEVVVMLLEKIEVLVI